MLAPRNPNAAFLPLVAEGATPNIRDALTVQIEAEKALDVQSNGDIVELMEVQHIPASKALVLLFHRASPNAADPAYRKKAAAEAGKKPAEKFTIRTSVKNRGEEQSVSAHLVIREKDAMRGAYRAVLEEIPGISMAVVREIIAKALYDYPYEFMKRGNPVQTYSTVKALGLKSETMEGALEKGEIDFVTLVRPAKPKFVDAEGIFEPTTETMKLRVKQKITPQNYKDSISSLFKNAKENGWEQFNIDIALDDNRKRTVKVEKDQEAKELLFVRSEQLSFKQEIPVLSAHINEYVASTAIGIAGKG